MSDTTFLDYVQKKKISPNVWKSLLFRRIHSRRMYLVNTRAVLEIVVS